MNISSRVTGSLTKVKLFSIPVTLCSLTQGIAIIEDIIASGSSRQVVLANAHTLNLAYEKREYMDVLKRAAVVLRDGTGISWALKRKGIDPLHNFVGTDFIPAFCMSTAYKGYRIFLLGSESEVAQLAARKLEAMAPGIVISGFHHGFFNEDKTPDIVAKINASSSDVLLVAMGNPGQEFWIANNLYRLNVPVCIGVGALFDYLSGRVVRAPQWMLNAGMEWVFRLMVEPGRLWRRYVIGNPKFIYRIYIEHGLLG